MAETSDKNGEELSPISPEAIEAREKLRAIIEALEEEERARRVTDKDYVRSTSSIDLLVTVQEDLLRVVNLRKVKEAQETERIQRITEDKKRDVHEELVRKAIQKAVAQEEEQERERRIEASKHCDSEEYKTKMETYNILVKVQEDLLRTVRKMQAEQAIKEGKQQIAEVNKAVMQEQLLYKVHKRQVNEACDQEQDRRVNEQQTITVEEMQQRQALAEKLIAVQKELLANRVPSKAIPDHHSALVLEDFKVFMQEQLIRKSNQRDAIQAMDQEKERRISETREPIQSSISDAHTAVLEDINKKKNQKEAKQMAEETQQEYIREQQKSKAQEDALRNVNQKLANKAMDKEQKERISEMNSKTPPSIDTTLKKEITARQN